MRRAQLSCATADPGWVRRSARPRRKAGLLNPATHPGLAALVLGTPAELHSLCLAELLHMLGELFGTHPLQPLVTLQPDLRGTRRIPVARRIPRGVLPR